MSLVGSLVVQVMVSGLYSDAVQIVSDERSAGGSLKSRVFNNKSIKSNPLQLYALIIETYKWNEVLKEVIERSEILKHETKQVRLFQYNKNLGDSLTS